MNFVGFKRSQKLKGNSSNKRYKQLSKRQWHKSQKLILPHFNKGRPVIFFKGTAAASCSSRLPSKNKSITSNATRGDHSLKSQGVKPKCNRINHYFQIGKLVHFLLTRSSLFISFQLWQVLAFCNCTLANFFC